MAENHDLSMREKSVLKRRINREHNSNFHAGYININEPYLHKTGIRGRKLYLLYCSVLLLIILAVMNILMTAGVVYVMKFTPAGARMLEFIPDYSLLRFLAEVTLPTISIYRGNLGSRTEKSLHLQAENDKIILNSSAMKKMKKSVSGYVDMERITLKSAEGFSIIQSKSRKTQISTKIQQWAEVRNPGLNLHVPIVHTMKVQSKEDVNQLIMEANGVFIAGMEGFEMTSNKRHIHLTGGNTLYMHSKVGEISFEALEGIYINRTTPNSSKLKMDPDVLVYKVCVCMPSGRVFAVTGGKSANCLTGAGICL